MRHGLYTGDNRAVRIEHCYNHLWLTRGRTRLGGALLHQVGLNLEFLIGRKIDLGAEALITRQADGYLPVARRDQQTLSDASELTNVANELAVDEDCGTIGRYCKLDLRNNRRHPEAWVSNHLH